MSVVTMMHWIHVLSMVVVLGGYIFLSFFWWPVLRRVIDDVRLQVRLVAQTLRQFYTTVVVALTVQVITGGLYLLPPAYRSFGAGQEAALVVFHRWLIIKLIMVFVVLLLVPMQLFGMAFRLTRMDAGIHPFDATLFVRLSARMQTVSYVIIVLLSLVVLISIQL